MSLYLIEFMEDPERALNYLKKMHVPTFMVEMNKYSINERQEKLLRLQGFRFKVLKTS